MKAEAGTSAVRAADDFRLGDWLVQPSLNRVSRPGEFHQVEPKVMDVLVFLANQDGGVVAQREIVSAIWAKQFMARTIVPRAIAELRRTLGDDAQAPRFIQTIPKRGYRILVSVLPAAGRPGENAGNGQARLSPRKSGARPPLIAVAIPAPSGSRYARWLLVAASLVVSVIVLVSAIVAALGERLPPAAPRHVSPTHGSAVRPLQDLSQDLKRTQLA